MSLQIRASHDDLVKIINDFNPEYHKDYEDVRKLAKLYFGNKSCDDNTKVLAVKLRNVLCSWGASKRKAPHLKETAIIVKFLVREDVRLILKRFGDRDEEVVIHLISVLQMFSDEIFEKNTNVTYPMKALLLLTGFMPALDSQVREGLKKSNFSGFSSTQFLMPDSVKSVNAHKILSLYHHLMECQKKYNNLLSSVAEHSKYPHLTNETGRIFDILFFMNAKRVNSIFFFDDTEYVKWYCL